MTEQPTTPPPAPPRRGWRRAVPRGRLAVTATVVAGVLVAGAIVAALVVPAGWRSDRPGPGRFADVAELGALEGADGELGALAGLDVLGGPEGAGGPGGPGGLGAPGDRGGPGEPDGPRGHGRFGGPGRVGPIGARLGDDTLLAGTVVSTGNGTLVLTPDGGAPQRTVKTDDRTRVLGSGHRAVGELTAGERAVVRVDGTGDAATAVAVLVPRTRIVGTVTALTGNDATVVAVNGLTVTADLTNVGQKPAVGDLVVLTGGANGATLRADEARVLPRTP